jgi:hypothetical protein
MTDTNDLRAADSKEPTDAVRLAHLRHVMQLIVDARPNAGRGETYQDTLRLVQAWARGALTGTRPAPPAPPNVQVYDSALLTPYSLWRHRKGDLYVVLGVSQCSTNGSEGKESVVYYSLKYKALRDRVLHEFLDGRFVPVEE